MFKAMQSGIICFNCLHQEVDGEDGTKCPNCDSYERIPYTHYSTEEALVNELVTGFVTVVKNTGLDEQQ